jgi:hypothetical protein
MNCQDFWNAMPELEGEPAVDGRAHREQCPPCAGLLDRQRALTLGLRAAAAEWRREQAPARLESKLVAAFRGEAGLAAPPHARRWWAPVLTWSAPAVVLAAAALLFVIYERQPAPPAQTPAASEFAAVDWAAALALDEDPNAARGQFISLPNAGRLPPDGHVNLVHMEVPRSAMIALGYSVEAERAAERVQADVILGSDGLARAVRFLDE